MMKATTALVLLALVLVILIAWRWVHNEWLISFLPTMGLFLAVFVVLLIAMPESRNSFRLIFILLPAQRAMQRGDYDDADAGLRRALALAEHTGRAADQNLGQVLFNLAELHRLLGRYGEAELLYVQALRHQREAFKPTHRLPIYTQHNLGVVYIVQGRFADAEPICAAAFEQIIEKHGPAHPYAAVARCNLAKCWQGMGRFAEAEQLYNEVLEQLARSERPDDQMTRCVCRHNLAEMLLDRGRLAEVGPLLQQAQVALDRTALAGRQEAARLLHTEAELLRQQGQAAEAETLNQQFMQQVAEVFPPQHPVQADGWLTLARLRAAEGKLPEAADLYQRCWNVWEPLLAPEMPRRAQCGQEYADVLRRLGREQEAAQLTAKSREQPVWVQAAEAVPRLNRREPAADR